MAFLRPWDVICSWRWGVTWVAEGMQKCVWQLVRTQELWSKRKEVKHKLSIVSDPGFSSVQPVHWPEGQWLVTATLNCEARSWPLQGKRHTSQTQAKTSGGNVSHFQPLLPLCCALGTTETSRHSVWRERHQPWKTVQGEQMGNDRPKLDCGDSSACRGVWLDQKTSGCAHMEQKGQKRSSLGTGSCVLSEVKEKGVEMGNCKSRSRKWPLSCALCPILLLQWDPGQQ